MKIISASIDLKKIDRSKIVFGKTGAEYVNIQVLLRDEKDQYGNDVAITLNQSKEERESGVQKIYIGNGKTVFEGENRPPQSASVGYTAPAPQPTPAGAKLSTKPTALRQDVSDDLPF